MSIRKDNLAGADLVNMSIIQYNILDGKSFVLSRYTTIGAAGGNLDYYFQTPSLSVCKIHFNCFVSGTLALKAILLESVTTTANGTTLTAYNLNRNSNVTEPFYIHEGPTWSTTSELTIGAIYSGATITSQNIMTGYDFGDSEIILKADTKYIMRLTNLGAATNTVFTQIEYYRE